MGIIVIETVGSNFHISFLDKQRLGTNKGVKSSHFETKKSSRVKFSR